ncbi:MAG: hypothetical protein ACREOU_11190 [Candidatus Eiseniibacteriota bacterium]
MTPRLLTSGRVLVLAFALALAFASCTATIGGKDPKPPDAGTAPAPSSTDTARVPEGARESGSGSAAPRAAGTVTAPWDTAARSREARRNHVYPKGESAIGKRLVESLPDPARLGTGASASTSGPAPGSTTSSSSSSGSESAPRPPDANPTPVSGDCWEVQLLLTTDKGRAEHVRDEAEKRLNVSVWVRTEGAIHKVRAGGCLSPDGAARLAERVKGQGYPEAFRVPRVQ